MKAVISILSVIFCISLCVIFLKGKKVSSFGTVIILNGPSGSGKTSIQKEFQKLMMPNLWIKTGIDDLFDRPMPDITPENMEFWQSKNPNFSVYLDKKYDLMVDSSKHSAKEIAHQIKDLIEK